MNKKIVLSIFAAFLVVAGALFTFISQETCGKTCFAGHMAILSVNIREKIEAELDGDIQALSEMRISSPYISHGKVLASGDLVLFNADLGISMIFEIDSTESGVSWSCTVYPDTIKPMFESASCKAIY